MADPCRPSLVSVSRLSVQYRRGGILAPLPRPAVSDVSFEIPERSCFSLVGESGSGKSTVVKAMLGLVPIASGQVRVGRFKLPGLPRAERLSFRREAQVVFQDPYLSLNPRLSVRTQVEEPLAIHGIPRPRRQGMVTDALVRVGLDPAVGSRRPSQLSGGQRQRACIARALVLGPRFLIADEPVSSLDLTVQAQVVELLCTLRRDAGLTLLFVSHDMDLVGFLAEEVGVMYGGTLVEVGRPAEIFARPLHPYTQALMASVPSRLLSMGLPEDPGRKPAAETGCRYRLSCPLADLSCELGRPTLLPIQGRKVACEKVVAELYR